MQDKQRLKRKVLTISIFVGLFVLALKVYSVYLTGSIALKSDALESIVNIAATLFALGAVIFGARPADQEHPYGHGKIENFSAAFEGGLIAIASGLIINEALHKFFIPAEVRSLNVGIVINFIAGSINGILGWVILSRGKKLDSKALEADGHHLLSDFYTTLGVVAGLIIMNITGFAWLDATIALLVGLLLAYTGFKLIWGSWNALLDKEDPAVVAGLLETIMKTKPKDVIALHNLKVLRSGSYYYIDIHVVVPAFYDFRTAHDLSKKFTNDVIATRKIEGEFHTHVDPCDGTYCINCGMDNCKIRAHVFVEYPRFTIGEITATRAAQLSKQR
jgi:cation diffusion facilitator family transporter